MLLLEATTATRSGGAWTCVGPQFHLNAFAGVRDLYLAPDATVAWCTGSSATTTNRNSISAAFRIDSL